MSLKEENYAENASHDNPLPLKSQQIYMTAYENLIRWKTQRNKQMFDDDLFLEYFTELAKVKKPSTLWAQYSMLKATMKIKHQVNMTEYVKLLSFLRRYAIGYKSDTSKVLTEDDIIKFVIEAPDKIYLATKVVLIIGVGGACKVYEMTDFTVNDIENYGDIMLVQVKSNVGKRRTFIIKNEFVPVVRKYLSLRPKNMPTNRFFINYRAGKCTRQVIGRNKLSALPKQVAAYLKLPNAERYTGHCYKRSSFVPMRNLVRVQNRINWQGAQATTTDDSIKSVTTEGNLNAEQENINNEVDVKVERLDEDVLNDSISMDYYSIFESNSELLVPDSRANASERSNISDAPMLPKNTDFIRKAGETTNLSMSSVRDKTFQLNNNTQDITVAGNTNIVIKNCTFTNVTFNFHNM